jgi:hypothetical protein
MYCMPNASVAQNKRLIIRAFSYFADMVAAAARPSVDEAEERNVTTLDC